MLPSFDSYALFIQNSRIPAGAGFSPACAGVTADSFPVNPEPVNGYLFLDIGLFWKNFRRFISTEIVKRRVRQIIL